MTQEKNEDNEKNDESTLLLSQRQGSAVKVRHPMEFLLKRGSALFLKAGDIAEGHVLERRGSRLYVDLGSSGMGIVYGREYYIARDTINHLTPGDAISAKVVDPDNEDGYVELSLKEAGEEKRWVELKKIMQEGTVLDVPIGEANRGGLILELKGVKGFLPASQLSSKHYPRVEGGDKEKIFQELQKLVGETIRVKILDMDVIENKLIFTEKEIDQEGIRAALAKYKVGDEVKGEITGVVDFGAFMKFDDAGLEGLIHISEIDWTLIEDPRRVLKIGDELHAKIIDIHGDKVSLSLKALKDDPWQKAAEKYKKGDTVQGRVTKLNPFGAFVELDAQDGVAENEISTHSEVSSSKEEVAPSADAQGAAVPHGIQGLVHISEFGTETKMREELLVGKAYSFKVLLVDPGEHRMSLGVIRESEGNGEWIPTPPEPQTQEKSAKENGDQ